MAALQNGAGISLIQQRLFALQDIAYRDFTSKLTPNIDKDTFIGVRMPALKALAKELKDTPEAAEFLNTLPHEYFEENNLHAFLLNLIRDFDTALEQIEAFLPYVDNWSTCDTLSPKAFAKNPEKLPPIIERWLASGETYTVRYGIKCLMNYFLGELFSTDYADMAATVQSEEYYVNMMRAWYFATALAKQYDAAVKYIEDGRLDTWTHNKAIQKAAESYRVTDEHKAYLKTLRRKA